MSTYESSVLTRNRQPYSPRSSLPPWPRFIVGPGKYLLRHHVYFPLPSFVVEGDIRQIWVSVLSPVHTGVHPHSSESHTLVQF